MPSLHTIINPLHFIQSSKKLEQLVAKHRICLHFHFINLAIYKKGFPYRIFNFMGAFNTHSFRYNLAFHNTQYICQT